MRCGVSAGRPGADGTLRELTQAYGELKVPLNDSLTRLATARSSADVTMAISDH
jgi:hypothetical protein